MTTWVAVLLSVGVVPGVGDSKPPVVARAWADSVAESAPLRFSERETRRCLRCHGMHGFAERDSASGRTRDLSVDSTLFRASVHGRLECRRCHVEIAEYPHRFAVVRPRVSCGADCHAQDVNGRPYRHHRAVADFAHSAHAQGLDGRDPDSPTCVTCHGNRNPHAIASAHGKISAREKIALCAGCHDDRATMIRHRVDPEAVASYRRSFHFKEMRLSKAQRWTLRVGGLLVLLAVAGVVAYPHLINRVIPYAHRPERIVYPVQKVNEAEFEAIARDLQGHQLARATVDTAARNRAVYQAVVRTLQENVPSFYRRAGLTHIERFRKAGIRAYEGPKTCLRCHGSIRIADGHGGYRTVKTRDNIVQSIHFALNKTSGFNTYGFNGKKVEGIPMGKIDRACGIPGSFTWTGWATLVKTRTGELRSDGCGQCHAGGQYGPMTGTMFPGYSPVQAEFESMDCLICHSAAYNMNQKYVVRDPNGKYRWNQDRSMKAAMAVERPTSDNCLRCHEHNHGGDMYSGNLAAQNLGYKNRRLLHPGAKRGNPTRGADIHYAAGLQCLDCHESHGHLIARGTRGTDLVSNDLPGVEVSCEKCHGSTPHVQNKVERAFLNAHTDKLACETCHITHLTDDNVVLRDWTDPIYNAEEGVWVYRDLLRSGKPGEALVYRWHNGAGTFMAGALGDNPNGLRLYRAFTTTPDTPFVGFDYAGYYEKTFRPIADLGKSKIAPFKRFNAKMYEDLGNQGPFGGMLLPFDYNVYYETGNPRASVAKALKDPLIEMMYGPVFKAYMMDAFMNYMGVAKGWSIPFSGRIAPKWMCQDATLMLNHSITKDALRCESCHAPSGKGILPFEELGYPPARVQDLRNLEELKMIRGAERAAGARRPRGSTRAADRVSLAAP